MNTDLGELSQYEVDLIKKSRQQAERDKSIAQLKLSALQIAAGYEKWLQENERGSSFSTFHEEYGCKGNCVSSMFKIVEELRARASDYVTHEFI